MTFESDSTCRSTDEVVPPLTASLCAVTVSPVLAVSPSALSCGYGEQSQLAPRGTESPSAVIVRDGGELAVDEDVRLFVEQAVATQLRRASVKIVRPVRPGAILRL